MVNFKQVRYQLLAEFPSCFRVRTEKVSHPNDSWQVVIIKRGTLDHTAKNNPLQNLMANIFQLFASNDLNMVSVTGKKVD